MSMFSAIYKGMTGLLGFSKSLDNLSTNVSNLNTPGYKGRDMFFRELSSGFDGAGDDQNRLFDSGVGQGVQIAGSSTRFSQGDIQQTGNIGDMAIDGNGFFILRDGSNEFYTRGGQFRVDDDGFLVDPTNGLRVAGLDENGELVDINIRDNDLSAPIATATVTIAASLASGASVGTVVPPQEDISEEDKILVDIFGETGDVETVELRFVKQAGSSWEVQFLDENGSPVANSHTIDYNGLGAPLLDTQTYTLSFEGFEYVNEDAIDDQLTLLDPITLTDGDISTASSASFSLEDAQLIVRDDETISYTEGGEFSFDSLGNLVDADGRRLAARSVDGVLEDLNIAESLIMAAQPTEAVTITGVISSQAAIGDTYPPAAEDPITFDLVDDQGDVQTLELRLEKIADNSWEVVLSNSFGTVARPSESLNFLVLTVGDTNELSSANQSVDASFEFGNAAPFNFVLNFVDGNGESKLVESQDGNATSALTVDSSLGFVEGVLEEITVGDQGILLFNYSNGQSAAGQQLAVVNRSERPVQDISFDFSTTRNLDTTTDSSVSISDSDGRANGQLVRFGFETNGEIAYTYSNGDEANQGTIALAAIANLQNLVAIGDTLFKAKEGTEIVLGAPEDGAFGSLQADSLELSNVELSQEFAEIIIVQRGFQASSQVLNASDEMIEELYNSVRGG